jgi:large subunit ribosomal protein L29
MAKGTPKAKDLRQMSDDQLQQSIKEAVKDMFQLRFRSSTERTATSSKIREQRRLIARIKTIQRQRATGPTATSQAHASQP